MSYRYMRILVMFDLPVTTLANRKNYTQFRKYLIKSGFLMVQESIYCKISPNSTSGDAIVENIRKNKPSEGNIQVLRITEKQYSKIEYIVGEKNHEVINDDRRLVII